MQVPDKWLKNKSDEAAVTKGCYWEASHAERVRDFCYSFCRLGIDEWAGKPIEFMDWQWNEIIQPLFNWRRPDGTRRFSQCSIWLPKNQGKSTLCAALSLYELVGSQTPSA